jgi:CRISPR-associated protein Cas2
MSLFLVISYDIIDDRRRLRVAATLEDFGERVQKSVFECHLEDAQIADLKARIETELDTEQDRVRYYQLCPKDCAAVVLDGVAPEIRDWDYHVV